MEKLRLELKIFVEREEEKEKNYVKNTIVAQTDMLAVDIDFLRDQKEVLFERCVFSFVYVCILVDICIFDENNCCSHLFMSCCYTVFIMCLFCLQVWIPRLMNNPLNNFALSGLDVTMSNTKEYRSFFIDREISSGIYRLYVLLIV
jgi:hypothetical protein